MDIRTLRYFVEVIRQQSFTRAAAKLYVTQPTISKMLKHLEEELDCRLIVREGRALKMTDSGQWDFLAAMVAAGIGLAVLPEPLCRRLDSQRLLWLPLMPQMLWQLGLIWRQNSYLSHGAQAWIVACRKRWLPGERLRGAQQAPR
ncbi:LysR family transcriptional regulator [Sodalis praecaptivus]|uniref:LysR family transcriptional regulator n=1 Tax=Sodalis praecaptivus TaxID=1239307 RepID=UPI0027E6C5C5|nr:LysR family transcriptional regulator [Sodalis praecaptivus]CAJ0997789.1 HTH-type transcriptional regulator ArgP [Sodalis praecaptivus]